MTTEGTLITADLAVAVQAAPMARVESAGRRLRQFDGSSRAPITTGSIGSGISAWIATIGTGRRELKLTKNSKAARASDSAVYTTATPLGFHRPPYKSAPSPSNASAARVASEIRQTRTLIYRCGAG